MAYCIIMQCFYYDSILKCCNHCICGTYINVFTALSAVVGALPHPLFAKLLINFCY